jgi:uncharacterized protein (TIGR03546 family)
MLTLLVKLLAALNSESSARQISLAITLGFMMGVSPLLSLHNAVLLFMVLVIRVHLASFTLALGIFSGLGYLFSGAVVSVGESLLTAPTLQDTFTAAYQYDWFKLAHLHHTYTLGALVVGLILAVPVYFLSLTLVVKYRDHVKTFFEKLRIVKALKASKFYQLYCDITSTKSIISGGNI